MANNELLIKINADAKNAKKAFDDVRDQTSDLEDQLKNVALISAAAFAALTAEIFLSVKAFEASDKATRTLSQSLQNQGIFTKDLVAEYRNYASAVQEATGMDDDAIVSAQAVAQGFLGQTKITKELTFAIADLAETMGGDLEGAASMIGKSIGTQTNALARYGLELNATDTEAQKLAKTLEFVNGKAGGFATAANQGVGGIRGLQNAFGDFQEQIGARFAPVVAGVIKLGTQIFTVFANSPVLADLATAFITAGVAVTGIAGAIAVAIPAFLALKAAVVAFGISFNIAFLGIPLLIGAVVAGATLLALNWEKSMAAMKAAAIGALTLITELFGGLGQIMLGVSRFNVKMIEDGLLRIRDSVSKTVDTVKTTYAESTAVQAEAEQKQNEAAARAAAKREAEKRRQQNILVAIDRESLNLLRLQNENASAELIQLKQRELETLRALGGEKSAEEIAILTARYEEIKALQDQQRLEDLEREIAFKEVQAEVRAELEASGIAIDTQIRQAKLAEIQATAQTEADIERELQAEKLRIRIDANNKFLKEQKQYGTAFATINKFLNSEEVQGAKTAAGELVQLQNSKNKELKSIGKAAAQAQIAIATAEAAMNVYRGFSTIPIVGQALGIAAAAATIIYGGERIAEVQKAQDGGLVEGGVPGRDSVPFLLEPGELVVPKRNFNDVVGAVQGGGQNNGEMLAILKSIDDKFSNPQTTILQGDIMADDSYIDALVRKISDAVEFRNAQIFGVTA